MDVASKEELIFTPIEVENGKINKSSSTFIAPNVVIFPNEQSCLGIIIPDFSNTFFHHLKYIFHYRRMAAI
jgi:hypothetical protein